MKTIGVAEFKARCIALLKDLEKTREPLVITHRGRPVARLEAIPKSIKREPGGLSHLGQIVGDLADDG
ncbi:MAG TPA: type II toxin-antitoxin system Phd/YefM family antitoxin, partial [Candidatus Xenobia bacterium]